MEGRVASALRDGWQWHVKAPAKVCVYGSKVVVAAPATATDKGRARVGTM